MATITDLSTGLVAKPLSTKEWANSISTPPMQGPVQPARAPSPAPVITPVVKNQTPKLSESQITLLKKNNPALYTKLYGGSAEVNATDIATPGVTVPPAPSSSSNLSSSLAGVSGTTTSEAQAQEMTPRDVVQQRMVELFGEGQSYDPAAIKTEMGVYAQEKIVNQLSKEYDTAITEQRRKIQEMRQNPEGKLVGALQADIDNFQYESDQNLADKAMALHYARADYQGAYNMAQDAIDAQESRYTKQMDFYKSMYTMLGDDMTDSEQMTYESNLRTYENQIKTQFETKNLAMQRAAQSGAPVEVLTAIKNAQTPEQVWQAAGAYGEDPSLTFQRDKFGAEMNLAWTKFDSDRKLAIRSLELQEAQRAGDISAERAATLQAQIATDNQIEKGMLAINEALGNSLGFSVATGASRGVLSQVITGGKYALGGAVAGGAGGAAIAGVGAIPGAIGGGVIGLGVGYTQAKQAKEDFAGDINYIVNNLTLQKIQEAKAAGVTFGALSDTEMRIIGSSADQLASLWDAEKSVFTGSPEEVEKNLKTLYETFESKKISSGLGAEKESAINNAW